MDKPNGVHYVPSLLLADKAKKTLVIAHSSPRDSSARDNLSHQKKLMPIKSRRLRDSCPLV